MTEDPQHFGGAWECVAWCHPAIFYPNEEAIGQVVVQRFIDEVDDYQGEYLHIRWPDTIAYAERGTEAP